MAQCKIVVAPHVSRGPRATSRRTFNVSQQSWKRAVDHAKTGDTTVFLSCDDGELRIATCTETNMNLHGTFCRLDADLGGNSSKIIAGRRRK